MSNELEQSQGYAPKLDTMFSLVSTLGKCDFILSGTGFSASTEAMTKRLARSAHCIRELTWTRLTLPEQNVSGSASEAGCFNKGFRGPFSSRVNAEIDFKP